jgi:heterodisulfide reductase subunit A-like polyferredoxin
MTNKTEVPTQLQLTTEMMQQRVNDTERSYKECKRCHKVLPFSAFGPHSKSVDGLQSYCRHCCHDYAVDKRDKQGLQRLRTEDIIQELRRRGVDGEIYLPRQSVKL